MQSKGFIKWVAILLCLACLYELSFTFVTKNVEEDAVEYAEATVAQLIADNTVSEEERAAANEILASVSLTKEDSLHVQKYVDDICGMTSSAVKKFSSKDSLEVANKESQKLLLGKLEKEEAATVAAVLKKDSISTLLAIPYEKAKELDKREKFYLDSVSNIPVYNLGIKKYTYKECKEEEMNLGLDLKGGMNIMLGVQVGDVVKNLANDSKNAKMLEALKVADQSMKESSDEDYIEVFAKAYGEGLAGLFANSNSDIKSDASDAEVISKLQDKAEAAIETSLEVISNRIDRFGVVQPNIQRITGTNRIMVELPGVKDPKRVEKLLSGAASLEFWTTYSTSNNSGRNVADVINAFPAAKSIAQAYKTENPEAILGSLDALVVVNYGGGIVGFVENEKDKQVVDEYLALKEVADCFPDEVIFMWGSKAEENNMHMLYAIYDENADGKPALDGSVIDDARAQYAQTGSSAEVSMVMNASGVSEWSQITGENVGEHIAIVLDRCVYSAPVVNHKIETGQSSISGNFTIQEAEDLANILKSGKVPASSEVIYKEVVGPSLGQESIDSGLRSIIFAFVLVLLYMLVFYRRAGLIADIALILNVFILVGCIVSLGSALTLPGIAGIVLTMGMAVDANVIIFERIKEELRGGKGIHAAIKDGFSNAYSAIIDGNLTTIITGIVLFMFGTGPVKGFATTLIIGILTSAFTAIFITRLLLDRHVAKRGKITFSYKWSENLLSNFKFDFIGKRFWAYIISGVVILAGVVSLTFNGLNYGVEFTGGNTYVVRFDQSVAVDDVRVALNEAFEAEGADAANSSIEVKQYGGDDQVRIVTQYEPSESQYGEGVDKNDILDGILHNALSGFYKEPISYEEFVTPSDDQENDYGITSASSIGPAIAEDMTQGAIFSIIFALIAIGLYIVFRFRKWQWAAGATVALAHDAFMIIALFSLLYSVMPFNLEVNQAFIAAILTIIGYSINDTVVIFDRIREYIGLYPKRDLKSTINSALGSTMMRTLNTSGTTLVTLLAIFILGGEAIQGFVFALIIGVVVGTYSSLFIASPLAYDMQRKKAIKQQVTKE